MIIKQIVDENFINYKEPSMLIAFGKCDWKCGKENCQNRELADLPDIEIPDWYSVVIRYLNNKITSSVVLDGLEPFDSFDDVMCFIEVFRLFSNDNVVIYTGYTEEEITSYAFWLTKYKNIIIKYGRYIPDQKPHYDDVLGIYLASDNQYGKVVS